MGGSSDAVPAALEQILAGRDDSPLPDDALVKFQHIGLAPGISKNFRFVLFEDGRLFSAVNAKQPQADEQQRFNVDFPDEASASVPDGAVEKVRTLLQSTGFAQTPAFVSKEGVRDGAVVIVAARVDGAVHEVWYRNSATELTDYLWELHDEATQGPLDLDGLLADLSRQPREDGT